MSSSPRNTGPSNRYGGDGDYGKRKKSFYPSSTRRDFKSSSNSPLTLPVTSAAAVPSSTSKPALRADASASNEYAARPRYRDSASSGNSSSTQSSRQNSYSKDSRYGSYGSKYPYNSNYYQDRNSGAYGSFSSAKRAENENFATSSTGRDSNSRDMVNGTSTRTERQGFSRDSWGRERPKLHTASGPKAAVASRFNPNNIPVSSRNGLNGLSSSVSNDYKKERYESYDNSSQGRWKSYSSPRGDRSGPSGPSARFNTPKERIRSSGLTNSVGTPKRNDGYYPHRTHNNTGRFGRGGYDPETNGNASSGAANPSSREFKAKLISPLTESYYGTSQSGESTMNTYDGRESRYEEDHRGQHDEEDEEDEEEEEEEEDDDDDEEDDDEEDDEEDEEDNVEQMEEKVVERKSQEQTSLASEDQANHLNVSNQIDSTEGAKDENATVSLETIASEDHDSADTTVEYPDGCLFPQSKLEAAYHQLKTSLSDDTDYLARITSADDTKAEFTNLPFYSYNLKSFVSHYDDNLRIIKNYNRELKKKQLTLVSQYKSLSLESDIRREYMDEQIRVLHPVDDEARKELEAIDIRVKHPEPEIEDAPIEAPAQTGRRGRRHGDSVTTEAEFEEILKSLKKEQNDDPVARARQVAAEIPDLILDPLERQAFNFMDSNNFVHDKSKWENRIKTDFDTDFTEAEHDLFCDAFCRFPKRFGEISRYMGGIREFGECVMHYYITKKAVNYKFLVSQYKKKTTNKSARRKKKVKPKPLPSVEGFEAPTGGIAADESQPLEAIQHHVEEKIKEVDEEMSNTFQQHEEELNSQEPSRKKSRNNDGSFLDTSKKEHTSPEVTGVRARKERKTSDQVTSETDVPHPKRTESAQEQRAAVVQMTNELADGGNVADDKKNLKHITSYWSITEVEEFPQLLRLHGSRWSEIAEKLTTKSSTMVKNYFQRNAEKFGWDKIVADVERRRFQNVPEADVNSAMGSKIFPAPEAHVYNSGQTYSAGINQSQFNGIQGASQHSDSVRANVTSGFGQPVQQSQIQKPSIRNLLNDDVTPQKPQQVSPPVAQRTNNLSSLLNAPSSPAPELPAPAPAAVTGAAVTRRSNSIESLLG